MKTLIIITILWLISMGVIFTIGIKEAQQKQITQKDLIEHISWEKQDCKCICK